ncbi:unnamed protein product [Rangifer tarandus platyrhynchus]|uniref:Uncharacterized protein n=1 Tax=Rangifer tarandus platyrhynchus TaxID=3082113 RepID=A0AC59ZTP9_RANTA
MGNCSALQFPSNFGVHTKRIVPRQALSHLCILQGVSLVQDMHACSFFSIVLGGRLPPPPPPSRPTWSVQGKCRDFRQILAGSSPACRTPHPFRPPPSTPQSHHTPTDGLCSKLRVGSN